VLLIATMLRLALNLASTRLILSHGHEGTNAAGHVIEAFGNFVMAGNFVIGIIVFMILVMVNFVVITKGSGRIAEVAARFNLDAMPGKQMAIDADLSAGLIDEKEARRRRKQLEDESSFYGAMDGARNSARRRDRRPGGAHQHHRRHDHRNRAAGYSFSDAASSYTLLTVGDGLVTQRPR
jgi:flagellar biosynthesis protein FlhA